MFELMSQQLQLHAQSQAILHTELLHRICFAAAQQNAWTSPPYWLGIVSQFAPEILGMGLTTSPSEGRFGCHAIHTPIPDISSPLACRADVLCFSVVSL